MAWWISLMLELRRLLIKSHTKFQAMRNAGSCIFSNRHLNLRLRMWWQIEIPDCSSEPSSLNKLLNYRSMIYRTREGGWTLSSGIEKWTRSLESNGLSYLRYHCFSTIPRYWKSVIVEDTSVAKNCSIFSCKLKFSLT